MRHSRPCVIAAWTLVAACAGRSVRTTLPLAAPARADPPPPALAWGETRGTLERCGPRLEDGRAVQRFPVDLAAGEAVRFALRSSALDPLLRLVGPGGFAASNDDASPDTTDALLVVTAPAAGRYELQVTSYRPGQAGRYVLRAERLEGAGLGRVLEVAQATDETLKAPAPGDFAEGWFHFHLDGGTWLRLRVTSTEFDTVATVLGPGGQRWFNDDAHDTGADQHERDTDSTVELLAPTSGTYHLAVSAYHGQGTGRYRVQGTSDPPVVVRAGEAVPRTGYAGTRARGRLLGLYAGITAYAQQGRLYGCADDARFLARALEARHLQDGSLQRVLTDGAATRAAWQAGLAWLAATARPDDVVLVFFSGHGGTQAAPAGDRREPDGRDETLALFDGPVTDTEVAGALDGVHAGLIVLALDACQSGGFADDFLVAPGRVGLFSSDADALSDTAEPRRAGGYLSYYLRRGVLGEADARPRDGQLQVGELTDYLYTGFATDDRLMNASDSTTPHQHLVIRRDSVRWDQPLWRYPRQPDLALPAMPVLPLDSPQAPGRSATPASCAAPP